MIMVLRDCAMTIVALFDSLFSIRDINQQLFAESQPIFTDVFLKKTCRVKVLNSFSHENTVKLYRDSFYLMHQKIENIVLSKTKTKCLLIKQTIKFLNQGRHHVKFLWGRRVYVNRGPLILDNIRTLVKVLQKQNS